MRQILVPSLALALAALAAALPASAQPSEAPERSISVSGAAEVEAVPDLARVSAGVETRAGTAAEAMAANSAAMAEVFAALEAAGIERRDIQTSNLSLGAVWDHSRDNEPPQIIGYRASNIVSVRVRDVGALGGVIDAVTGAGANRLDGIGFELSDPAAAMTEARAQAVADARTRAETYARAAGVTLGPVLSIRENGQQSPQPFFARAATEAMDAAPISEGSIVMRAQVGMVFAIE